MNFSFLLAVFAALVGKVLSNEDAVLIVGGMDPRDNTVLSSTEFFGCPGQTGPLAGPEYPLPIYLTGGMYFSEDGSVDKGRVMACGGYSCEATTCTIPNNCYDFDPIGQNWTESPPLFNRRWGHILTTGPDLDGDSGRDRPIAVGSGTVKAEINDESTSEWRRYRDVQYNGQACVWYSFECLVARENKVYHMDEDISVLDLETWTISKLGSVPEFLTVEEQGRCSLSEISGELGIVIRSGYFFNLSDLTWRQLGFPPRIDPSLGSPFLELHTLGGKPTYFGAPICDQNIECQYKQVLQYQEDTNSWLGLGHMMQSRAYHEVIPIPKEFCPTKDSQPAKDPPETVAMIVGGVFEDGDTLLDSVELFGCAGSEHKSIPLQNFPRKMKLTAGVYYPDDDVALVCGGIECDPVNACYHRRDCFEYDPAAAEWRQREDTLNEASFGHLMGLTEDGQGRQVPFVHGLGTDTEFFNPDTRSWEEQNNLYGHNWSTLDCLVQIDEHTLFHAKNGDMSELDLTKNVETVVGTLPEKLRDTGRCAYLELEEKPGILLSQGYRYDLGGKTWQQLQFPPFAPFVSVDTPNAMFSFRDKPTIFGNTVCDENGHCLYTEVTQYDSGTDMWTPIGSMSQSRIYHAVFEVPDDFCHASGGKIHRVL